MTEKEILEGNKLIVEFMGYELWFPKERPTVYKINDTPIDITKLQYHSSWDWLMLIVGRIKKMQHDPKEMFMGTTLDRYISFANVTMLPIFTPIETVWKAVITFIKWYNEQRGTDTTSDKE